MPKDQSYVPIVPQVEEGMALVNLKAGQEYAVRLHNKLEYDVGVRLAIDGLNLFEFSKVPVDPREKSDCQKHHFIYIPAGASGEITGWHRNNKRPSAFVINDLPEHAAIVSAETSAFGTINATYFVAWSPGEAPPSLEVTLPRCRKTTTGLPINAQDTSVQRHVGTTILASVTILYVRPRPAGLRD